MGDTMFINENITQNTSVEYLQNKYAPYFNDTWNWFKSPNATDFQNLKQIQEMCYNTTMAINFDKIQLARVIVTWVLFVISAVGNSFVLYCIYKRTRTSHVHLLMMHFAIADLVFTFTVMPQDAMWNTTMMWYGGDFLCRLCQLFKHTGMYITSFMVVVTALDRCCGILQPMCTPAKQRKRTKYIVAGVWIWCVLCATPAAVFYGVVSAPYCPDRGRMSQCLDSVLVPQSNLRPYYFFTMANSFLFPMIFSVVFYLLVVWEISNMMRRDRARLGRRDSSVSIMRARKKTLMMTGLVVLSFLLFWGPYYGIGIYDWFNPEKKIPKQISTALFMLMYVHPAIHPFMYGVLMKDVRDAFKTSLLHVEKIVTCSSSESGFGDGSFLYSPNMNGSARSRDARGENAQSSRNNINGDERHRLISANSERGSGDENGPQTAVTTNGVLRTSTVSFQVPSGSRNGSADENVLNNNKPPQRTESNRDDGIVTSTT